MKSQNLYLVISLLVFASLKFAFSYLDVDNLKFLLTPTSLAIEAVTGIKSMYISGPGYFYPQLDILIDKSCSGYNFWLICFLMTSFVFIKSNIMRKEWIIPSSILFAYNITLLANISRISGYIMMLNQKLPKQLDPNNSWLHQTEGIFVYLSFLIMTYLTLNYITIKIKSNHEKTA